MAEPLNPPDELRELGQLVWPIIEAFDPDTLCSPVFGPDFRAAMWKLAQKMNKLELLGLVPERE